MTETETVLKAQKSKQLEVTPKLTNNRMVESS